MLTLRQTSPFLTAAERRVLLEAVERFSYQPGFDPIRFRVYAHPVSNIVLILMIDTRMLLEYTHLSVEKRARIGFARRLYEYSGGEIKNQDGLHYEEGGFIESWTATLLISREKWERPTEEVIQELLASRLTARQRAQAKL